MNGIAIVKDEAAKHGTAYDDQEAHYVLWELTGWPAFWHIGIHGDTPEECLRTQVRQVIGVEPETDWDALPKRKVRIVVNEIPQESIDTWFPPPESGPRAATSAQATEGGGSGEK